MDDTLHRIALQHAANDALSAEVEALYADLDSTISSHNPTCWNYGKCCRFGEFGHRLYVTAVELAHFVRGMAPAWKPPTADSSACPYQIEGKCTARTHRPLGCRIFYCDPNSQDWQNGEYEKRLAQLKGIGASHEVPYRYLEWLSALAEVHLPPVDADVSWIDASAGANGSPNVDPHGRTVVELPQVSSTDSHR